MTSISVSANLTALKEALQVMESAVQLPQDEAFSTEHITQTFPRVFELFRDTFSLLLTKYGESADSSSEVIRTAHARGWTRGDLALWLHLNSALSRAVSQDVRATSSILWETYELLNARFRWQTTIGPAAKVMNAH
jgi:hypothetical protein